MDRVIEKKNWSKKRVLTIAGVSLLALLIAGSFFLTSGKSRLNVDSSHITISEIKKGPFQEFIAVNGVVLPVTTIYLDALEGGRVEEKFVEDGAMMKKDQPILRLANTDLELTLADQETQVFNVLTQMQNTRNNADQNTIGKLNQMAEVDNASIEADRVYKLNKQLYSENAIGSQEFKASENNYNYQVKRKKLTQETLDKDMSSGKLQVNQAAQSYSRMQNALALMRKKVGDLIVRAPVDGQLTSLDAEIGQSKNKGERLGQIDVTTGFKIRVNVDEHYISRIFIGLEGSFPMAGKDYKLKIKKVYTQVTNGTFQVDMGFTDSIPAGIRRGQTLQIHLSLSDETEAVLIPKGGFYQQSGGNWVYKVNDNGTAAVKTYIQLGLQNPDYYQVVNGLKPGDKVVTSSYENYGSMEELIIKKDQ